MELLILFKYGIVAWIIYLLAIAIYRLYLSPIAKFPGPKLTALTGWVETYYDVVKGGQFTFQVKQWHEMYGPIIRINPKEIHVSDPDFHDVAYATSAPYDKLPEWNIRLGLPNSLQATVHHELHRGRRTVLDPYFSRKSILEITPYIQEKTDQLCNRLLREYKGTAKVVTLNDAWAALSTDIIFHYSFDWDYNFLSYPNFVAPFTESIKELLLGVHIGAHFNWFLKSLQATPDWFVGAINPPMKPVINFQNAMKEQIVQIMEGGNAAYKDAKYKTVFSDILASDLPPEEKTVHRMQQEAGGVVGAAIDTTKAALSLASFYILNDPKILSTLRAELQQSSPNEAKPPTLTELERLPYLTAIIKESLRLGYGASQRLPRISPHKPVQYAGWTIPAGTPFSMSNYLQHNCAAFTNPQTFDPERWLTSKKVVVAEGREPKPMDHYFVPFSRGTRNCLGQHLAMAELYIGLATAFRRLDLELFETGEEAVVLARDFFVPLPEVGTKGVRVIVK